MGDAPEILRLSPLQTGLVALNDIVGGDDGYLVSASVDVRGPLDVDRLRGACETVVARHPQLCARFRRPPGGDTVMILPRDPELSWSVREVGREELADADGAPSEPWDLRAGRVHSVELLSAGPELHRLVVGFHHAVIDAWSLAVVMEEILAAYSDGAGVLPPAPRLREYAAWLGRRDLAADERWWAEHLSGLAGPTRVGTGEDSGGEGARTTIRELPPEDGRRIEEAAGRLGVTPAALILSAWAVLVSRMTGEPDVVVGVSTTGRPAEVPGIGRMVGALTTTVPLRIRLVPGEPMSGICRRVHEDLVDAISHATLPAHRIERAAGIPGLFDTAVIMHNIPRADDGARTCPDGTIWEAVHRDTYAHYPLVCAPGSVDGGWYVALDERPGLLPDGFRADDVLDLLQDVLAGVCADPSGDYRGRGAARAITCAEDGTSASGAGAVPAGSVDSLMWGHACRTPDAIAIRDRAGAWTYGELARWAQSLAAELRARGIGRGDRVVVQLRRRREYLGAVFGILRNGSVLVPVDPEAPEERRTLILGRSGARLLVGDGDAAAPDGVPFLDVGDIRPEAGIAEPRDDAAGDDPAYVVFTSGSTGTPKGVAATHGGVLALHRNHAERIYRPVEEPGRRLRIAHGWSFAFDAAWQPQLALLSGHELVLLDEDARRDPDATIDALRTHGVDLFDTSPSMLKALRIAGLLDRGGLRVLALGSEDIPPDVWAELAAAEPVVHNFYGPTETTVEVTSAEVVAGTGPMIGRPAIGTRAYVLGDDLAPVPASWPGELYIGGPQVALGYAGDAPLTAVHFVPEPGHPGERMYRTGDIVRVAGLGGELSYVGRADRQVKVRGHRVELGEIEAGLRRCPGVRDAAATTVQGPHGTRIVAVAVADAPEEEIRGALRGTIPSYMLPDRIIPVDEIPLDVNGKTRLNEIVAGAAESSPRSAEPRTDAERLVADAVAAACGISGAGPDDELRALGVDSISVVSLIAELRRAGAAISVRRAWDAGTVADLAAMLEEDAGADAGERGAAPRSDAPEEFDSGMLRWLTARGEWARYAMPMPLSVPADATAERLSAILRAVAAAHPALASRWEELPEGRWRTVPAEPCVPVVESGRDGGRSIGAVVDAALDLLDPAAGIMVAGALLRADGAAMLVLCVHHLACDVYSQRILLEDLRTAWEHPGEPLQPEPVTPMEWYGRGRGPSAEDRGYWESRLGRLPRRAAADPGTYGEGRVVPSVGTIDPDAAAACDEAVVLAAYAAAWAAGGPRDAAGGPVAVMIEDHGRREDDDGPGDGRDAGRTVGWLSRMYPLVVGDRTPPAPDELRDPAVAREWVSEVRSARGAASAHAASAWRCGALREEDGRAPADSLVVFLGRTSGALGAAGGIGAVADPAVIAELPHTTAPGMRCPHLAEVSVGVDETPDGSSIASVWRWSPAVGEETAECVRSLFDELVPLLAGAEAGRR